MSSVALYPLRFEPIFQYRLWGRRRLPNFISTPMPDGLVSETWLLSDGDDHPSIVAEGPCKGLTIAQLTKASPRQLLGKLTGKFKRFVLLVKFLDANVVLSVQVHPSDEHTDDLPRGETGKTEAWVVLETGNDSRVFACLTEGTTSIEIRDAIATNSLADHLSSFRQNWVMESYCLLARFTPCTT